MRGRHGRVVRVTLVGHIPFAGLIVWRRSLPAARKFNAPAVTNPLYDGNEMSELEEIRLQRRTLEVEEQILQVLHRIERRLPRLNISGFKSKQENPVTPFNPGNTIVITFTPVPAGAEPASGDVPTITSSDPVNAPVTADATGLIATVEFPATAVPNTPFVISINYTNPDGTVATPGTFSGEIVAPPAPDITGFTAAQTS